MILFCNFHFQVNVLEQLRNISSYPFMAERLDSQETKMIAFWFDVFTGDVYMFSRNQERWVHYKPLRDL